MPAAASAQPAKLDPCALATQAEVKAALGKVMTVVLPRVK